MSNRLKLRVAVRLCLAVRAVVLVLESLSLYVFVVFETGVREWSRTGVDNAPPWIASANLWALDYLDDSLFVLWLLFIVLFAVALGRARGCLAGLGAAMPASALIMPFALLVPYLDLVVPWIGLHATRLTIRRVETPDVRLDWPTIGFAAIFDIKLLADELLGSPDIQPNPFQRVPRGSIYWLFSEKVWYWGTDAVLSAVLLVAFWLYWRAFDAQYAKSLAVHGRAEDVRTWREGF